MGRGIACLSLIALAACGGPPIQVTSAPPPRDPAITDGRGVLSAMARRYGGKWFRTLTFAQNTVTVSASGRETKGVWNEYLVVPGRLRIDYTPLADHGGVMFADGKIYSFVNGKVAATQNGWNPLLVLIADVYAQSVDTSMRQLDSLGFRMSLARQDTWNGKRAWVVGAAAGDTTASQFWIDVDSLLVRRVIQRNQAAARTTVTDIRLDKYKDVGGFPVAFAITFYRDGRLYFREDYFGAKTNDGVPADLFDPAKWVASQIRRE